MGYSAISGHLVLLVFVFIEDNQLHTSLYTLQWKEFLCDVEPSACPLVLPQDVEHGTVLIYCQG
jgi:hypothetical protein